MGHILRETADVALGVLGQLWRPQSSVYWLYLCSAFVLALVVYVVGERRKGPLSPGRALSFCVPRRVYAHRSFRHDAAVFAINAVLYSFLLLGPITGASMLAATKTWAALHGWFGSPAQSLGGIPARLGLTLAVVMAADLGFFLSHYAQHKVPFLWEFHKVHHSAPVLNPLTVFRRHPVDVVLERGLTGILAGVVLGVFSHLSGGTLEPLEVLGVNVGLFIFLLCGFNLQHTHVRLSFGTRLEHVLISPASHQIHHSSDPRHADRNLGNIFALWDWLFGTLYLPGKDDRIHFGLQQGEERQYDSVWRLYFRPFLRAARLIPRAVRRSGSVRDA